MNLAILQYYILKLSHVLAENDICLQAVEHAQQPRSHHVGSEARDVDGIFACSR